MMYGGYYQNMPGYLAYNNFGYQTPPGGLMQIGNSYNNGYIENNPFNDINNRLNELEIKVNNLEQKLNRYKSFKEEDDSIYML